jgi:hypothetical protein
MPKKYIDCREIANEERCTLAISGTEDEVLELAVVHACRSHGHKDTYELRDNLRSMLGDEPEILQRAPAPRRASPQIHDVTDR